MSDPVTNIEIEDVLSSIRRLVSEGDKPRPDTQAKQDLGAPRLDDSAQETAGKAQPEAPETCERSAPQDQSDVSDSHGPEHDAADSEETGEVHRFVLTPALRVDDIAATPEPANDGPLILTAPTVVQDQNDATEDSLEEAAEVLELTEAQEAFDNAEPAEASEQPEAEDETGADGEDAQTGTGHDSPDAEQSDASTGNSRSLEEKIAELEAAITHRTDDWEPDGSEETPVVDWTSSAAQAGLFAANARRPVLVEDAVELGADHTDSSDTADEAGEASDAVEAEDREAADAPMFRHVDAEEVFEAGPEMDAAAILGDDTVIDETMLREMIAEIVREELQGKLGERITRNVRKLVRREIYRVISSESFD